MVSGSLIKNDSCRPSLGFLRCSQSIGSPSGEEARYAEINNQTHFSAAGLDSRRSFGLVVLPDLRLMRGMRLRSPAAEPRATYPVPEPFERDADFPVCADAKEVGNVF